MTRRPWPRAAKITVASLAAVLVAVVAWRGGQDTTSSTTAAGVATTSTASGLVTTTSPTTSDATGSSTTTTASPSTTTSTAPAAVPTPSSTGLPPPTAPLAGSPAANRPDPRLTPGVADPAVSQANIHSTICVAGYTATVRNVSTSTKDRVYAEYGIATHAPGSYEVDHLISLELGGSNDIGNLWPEPYTGADNARDKDTMENRLHDEVCSGQITLSQGQDEIVHWWMYE